MHQFSAIVLFLFFFLTHPSEQRPSPQLVRSTGCKCGTSAPRDSHTFWLEPPPMEAPGDTCRRLAVQLEHWLDSIDDHNDLQMAWRLYTEVLQSRRARAVEQHRLLDAQYSVEGEAPNQPTQVMCTVEGMDETSQSVMLSDLLVVRLFLGAIALVVLFESLTTILG